MTSVTARLSLLARWRNRRAAAHAVNNWLAANDGPSRLDAADEWDAGALDRLWAAIKEDERA